MFLDFREFEAERDIEADLCIIGAGAAGITLARSLIGSRIQVCLLESGGFEFDEDIQSLYDGDDVGSPGTGSTGCRLRYFGGTTNHWNGWCGPLGDLDFELRPWVPQSGWPISKKDLDPYYIAAQKVCELGPYRYDLDAFSDKTRSFPAFEQAKIAIGFWQLSPPTRFGSVYREELEKAENVRVYLYANVTEIEVNETASYVRSVRLRTLDGKTGSAQARYVVLACGGIENARLLLLSDAVERHGLGNSHGSVGRYFMQHPHVSVASVLANDPEAVRGFSEGYKSLGARVRAGIVITAQAQEHYQILNYSATVDPQPDTSGGYFVLGEMVQNAKRGKWPDEFGEKLWRVITDLDSVSEGLYERARGRRYWPLKKEIILYGRSEQQPNPDSRVSLSEQRDQLGLRKIKVDWRFTELDKRTIRVATQLIGEELGRLGLGRIKLHDWLLKDNAEWPEALWGGCHHIGTTRMSHDFKSGIVDGNCRVHTLENLYIAGSSVFPTTGYVNPTLTIVALALRLSDQLKAKLSV